MQIATAFKLSLAVAFLTGFTAHAVNPPELYVKTYRAYVHSTEKRVEASCDPGDRLISLECFGENVLMEPGEPEHVIALEALRDGCHLKKHVPEQMVRLEAKATCAK